MTVEQFIRMLNNNYGIEKKWPKVLLVDSDTYANCCQEILNQKVEEAEWKGFHKKATIILGDHNGIMFKNIELILKT